MKNNKEKYGLTLLTLKTEAKPLGEHNFTDYQTLKKFLADNFKNNGFIVIYLDYAVLIRKFTDGKILFMKNENPFDPIYIQKLRLFNKDKELFLWRTEGKWKARLRTDDTGESEMTLIEANQVLFGTTSKVENGFTSLTETRGTEIILPFTITGIDAGKNRIKIKTRNYIGYNELGQAGYVDCRFVEFTFGEKNISIGEN